MRMMIATLLLAGAGAGVAMAQEQVARIEPESRFEFRMVTRWAQVLTGRFPDSEGEVIVLPDGRRQVRIRLSTATVEIVDHPRYTRFMRGPRFFDNARYPEVSFLSEPYTGDLLQTGGNLYGKLRMHGIERRERFVIAPAACVDAGRACPIVAQGVVRRSRYDLDTWRMAMRDEVQFSMHVRLRDTALPR